MMFYAYMGIVALANLPFVFFLLWLLFHDAVEGWTTGGARDAHKLLVNRGMDYSSGGIPIEGFSLADFNMWCFLLCLAAMIYGQYWLYQQEEELLWGVVVAGLLLFAIEVYVVRRKRQS